MNDIQIFQNPDFGEVRTLIIDGEPWFVGVDVARALGYKKPTGAVTANIDEGDSLREGISDANGHKQTAIVINESGLYALIFGSKLESAKKFKKWVTSEVLPSIRKTGSYSVPQTTDEKIALLAQGHTELKAEVDEIKAEVETIKSDLPLLPLEAYEIEKSVRRKGVEVLGGKQSNAYNDRGLRQKLYNNLYANLKYNFEVRTYKAIRRKDAGRAVQIVNEYKPPLFLAEQIADANSQQKIEFHN